MSTGNEYYFEPEDDDPNPPCEDDPGYECPSGLMQSKNPFTPVNRITMPINGNTSLTGIERLLKRSKERISHITAINPLTVNEYCRNCSLNELIHIHHNLYSIALNRYQRALESANDSPEWKLLISEGYNHIRASIKALHQIRRFAPELDRVVTKPYGEEIGIEEFERLTYGLEENLKFSLEYPTRSYEILENLKQISRLKGNLNDAIESEDYETAMYCRNQIIFLESRYKTDFSCFLKKVEPRPSIH